MPELIAPTPDLHTAWLEADREWGPGMHEDGFGLLPTDDVDSPAGFTAWVTRLTNASATTAEAGAASCTYRWITEGNRVLGGIALRHGFTELCQWAGHIGYGIRPSARGRGLATWALGMMLNEARRLGMGTILLVCATDNAASAQTIERNGGVFESIRETQFGPVRRYWITLNQACS